MATDIKSPFKIIPIILVVVFIIGYAFFEARGVILGPVIEIDEPLSGASFNESLIEVSGQVKNVSFISLNDAPLAISDGGIFQEKLLLSPGYNIMKLEAQDRFGRETIKYLELFYKLET